jgi:N-acetylmuramoyl-L-alanine amidase
VSPRRTLRVLVSTAALAVCGVALLAAPSQAAAPGPVAAQSVAIPTLKSGSRGPQVQALQERLSGLGYWLGTPNGTYGELTRQAVMALQGAAGLTRDGVVGPATRAALDRGVLPRVTVRTGHVVEIDRAAGTITVADDGTVRTVLHTSTGSFATYRSPSGKREIADTPAGQFRVYRTVNGVRNAELGRLYRPRYFDPSQGIAVHGAADVPGYPASHGCARVTNAAMDMIWAKDLMPMGSTVVVR